MNTTTDFFSSFNAVSYTQLTDYYKVRVVDVDGGKYLMHYNNLIAGLNTDGTFFIAAMVSSELVRYIKKFIQDYVGDLDWNFCQKLYSDGEAFNTITGELIYLNR